MLERNIIEEIQQSKGYKIALLTTFNFEINFFERCILRTFLDNNVNSIEVFVDAKELSKSISESTRNSMNKKYVVNPIFLNTSFHPKVILLLGDDRAKLIVSSSNLTISGYTLNNEIYNTFIYDSNNIENVGLINDAIKFFKELNEIAPYRDVDIFKSIEELPYSNKKSENISSKLLYNTNDSILNQIFESIDGKIDSIDIAVPYYDNNLLGYVGLKDKFNCNNINLYIQNRKSSFPLLYNDNESIVGNNQIRIYEEINGSKNFYHGKVFRFNTSKGSYVVYGSANCTQSALIRTYKEDGNIECDIIEKGSKNEFDYFFDKFKIDNSINLETNIIEYQIEEKQEIIFKYRISNEQIELFFNHYLDEDQLIMVLCENEELDFKYIEKEIVVLIPIKLTSKLENIFDVIFVTKNGQYSVKCWYIDKVELNVFRHLERNVDLNIIPLDFDNEKYRKYLEYMLDFLTVTAETYNEYKKWDKLIKQSSIIEDELENDDTIEDDFVTTNDVPDELIIKEKNIQLASNAVRVLAHRFFDGIKSIKNDIDESNNVKKKLDNSKKNETHNLREATSIEKKFERKIKRIIEKIQDEEYVQTIEYEEFKDLIGSVFDVITNFRFKEKIENMFEDDYISETSMNLLTYLLMKDNTNEIDKDSTIIMSLISILISHIDNSNYDEEDSYAFELDNKNLIKLLNDRYRIRDYYNNYTENVYKKLNEFGYDVSYSEINKYIDSLFDYKTQEDVSLLIKRHFGEDVEIVQSNDILTIKSKTFDIFKYLNEGFKREIVRIVNELFKSYREYGTNLETIKIIIKNIKNCNANAIDPIDTCSIIAKKNIIEIKTIRKSGNSYKPETIRI